MRAINLQHGPVGDDLALVHGQAPLVRARPPPLPGQRAVVLRIREASASASSGSATTTCAALWLAGIGRHGP